MIEQKFVERIAAEVSVRPEQAAAAIQLLDKGATAPFIAHYRKDLTGGLDEAVVECIEERNAYFTALSNRRNAAIDNIAKQDKLTDELRARLENCYDQLELEDLYLPYKKQRRSKASIAVDQGLEPLAAFLWSQMPLGVPIEEFAESFVNAEKSISSPEEALLGAQNILAERMATDASARAAVRRHMLEEGIIQSSATKNAHEQKTRFEPFYQFSEPVKSIPPAKLLTLLRGARMGALRMDLVIQDEAMIASLLEGYLKEAGSLFEPFLRAAVEDAYKRLLRPAIENEVIGILRARADEEVVKTLRENLGHMLMSPAAGPIPVMGVDPGPRTGIKMALVGREGKYLESATVILTEVDSEREAAAQLVVDLVVKHDIRGIAIASGAGTRDAARFIGAALKKLPGNAPFLVFVTHPAGAVYATSKLAQDEFPEMDITMRGAVSLARRVQDPLAELVRLEPRNIASGQHQFDVNQRVLREALYKTVVSCVNFIGADINTAPADVLRYISGLQMGTAQNIVEFRSKNGGFRNRTQLMEVSGIGEKTYEQCAAFLRIADGEQHLDRTRIHPEAYPCVEKMAEKLGVTVASLQGNRELVSKLDLAEYATETLGPLALEDIRAELTGSPCDPRLPFFAPKHIDGVYDIQDLEEGMEMEGVVTHVTDFGAFVDIGIRQDGLIHLSELANRFIRNPREYIKSGDVVRVKVLKVDKDSRRISLSRKAMLSQPRRPQAPPRPRPEKGEGETASMETRPRREPAGDRHRAEGRRREGQGDERGERPPRAERGERRERADRPERREPSGARPGGDRRESRPPRHADKRDRKGPARPGQPLTAVRSGDGDRLQNTLLADQLAALKERFGSS